MDTVHSSPEFPQAVVEVEVVVVVVVVVEPKRLQLQSLEHDQMHLVAVIRQDLLGS